MYTSRVCCAADDYGGGSRGRLRGVGEGRHTLGLTLYIYIYIYIYRHIYIYDIYLSIYLSIYIYIYR